MANLTLREVPESLHGWLKQQATRHRGSVNKEVLELLEGLQRGTTTAAPKDPEIKPAPLLDIGRRCAMLPVLDRRPEADILGYDADGFPGSLWSSAHPRGSVFSSEGPRRIVWRAPWPIAPIRP